MEKEIKKLVLNNQNKGAKMLAKEIIRLKNKITKINDFLYKLNSISIRISTLYSINKMNETMEKINNSINFVNSKLNLSKICNLSKNIIKENYNLMIEEDIFNDRIDEKREEIKEEEDKLYEEVLKEIGLEIENGLPKIIQKEKVKEIEEKVIDLDKILES